MRLLRPRSEFATSRFTFFITILSCLNSNGAAIIKDEKSLRCRINAAFRNAAFIRQMIRAKEMCRWPFCALTAVLPLGSLTSDYGEDSARAAFGFRQDRAG